MSERKTENLLERALKKGGFTDNDLQFQGGQDEEIKRCLPSKRSGKHGKGKPEHIIRLDGDSADLLVTECKNNKAKHYSNPNLTENSKLKPVHYAEDGILHYMKGLKQEFNVIGLAVSGTAYPLEITTFKVLRGGQIERLANKKVLKRVDYLTELRSSAGHGTKSENEIMQFTKELHNFLRDHMELAEPFKPLIVSGILLGLKDNAFERSYLSISDKQDLAAALYEGIERILKKANVKGEKLDAMMSNYDFIRKTKSVQNYLQPTISRIYRHLFRSLQPNSSFDLLGNFYGEFLRYSGGDQQGLGIVLTPRHITELFTDLANLNPTESVVLDICAGTAGFLITAMGHMVINASGDSSIAKRIKSSGIIGIETNQQMFTLACANMIFRGDGKANIFLDDCLQPREPDTLAKIKRLKPNVAMLNPPYSKKGEGKDELRFVKRALDLLQPNGIGIAIVPVPCLIGDRKKNQQTKKELLESHTLKAVMSMPPQLFANIGAVTAIVVFEAHKPHYRTKNKPRAKTWFAYWHDDGFDLNKKKRVERNPGIWASIKKGWLNAYFNQRIIPGKSCKHNVTHLDEWCAEAYMKTNYSTLSKADFEKEIKKFALYNLMQEARGHITTGSKK